MLFIHTQLCTLVLHFSIFGDFYAYHCLKWSTLIAFSTHTIQNNLRAMLEVTLKAINTVFAGQLSRMTKLYSRCIFYWFFFFYKYTKISVY